MRLLPIALALPFVLSYGSAFAQLPNPCPNEDCTGLDPYLSGCTVDAQEVGNSEPIDQRDPENGHVVLRYSPRCDAYWAKSSSGLQTKAWLEVKGRCGEIPGTSSDWQSGELGAYGNMLSHPPDGLQACAAVILPGPVPGAGDVIRRHCTGNQPPVCSGAWASPQKTCAYNHASRLGWVQGVSDPDGDGELINRGITGICQDQPVFESGQGAGRTDLWDAQPVASGFFAFYYRPERDGTQQNGRVYNIEFRVSDCKDTYASCAGAVQLCVPHHDYPSGMCYTGCVADPFNYKSYPESRGCP